MTVFDAAGLNASDIVVVNVAEPETSTTQTSSETSETTETTDLIVKPCEFRCILLNMSEDFTSDSPIVQKIADAVLSVK